MPCKGEVILKKKGREWRHICREILTSSSTLSQLQHSITLMTLCDFHLGWNLGGTDVCNLTLVNDKTNKEVVFD